MCCSFFFFFKQKTAYEMRISDWSSDVCSSDLDRSEAERRHRLQFLRRAAGNDHLSARTLQLQRDLASDPVAAAGDQHELSTKFHTTPPKIGRPSCRERVCQYV